MCTGIEIALLAGGLAASAAPALLAKKPDTSAAEAAQMEALRAQQEATATAKAKADTESEAVKRAQEERIRRGQGAGAFGSSFSGSFATPAVGYRTAFGE
jgi:hypothetical protein